MGLTLTDISCNERTILAAKDIVKLKMETEKV
jgi:hypothetical protein